MALKQYIENARDISGALEIYNKKLNMTGFSGANPYLEEIVVTNIKYVRDSRKINKYTSKIDKVLSKTASIGDKEIVEDVFAFYSELLILRSKLQQILDIFVEHQVNPIQKGSQTSTGSTITEDLIYDLQNNLSDLVETMDGYLTESDINRMTYEFADAVIHYLLKDYISDAHVKLITNEYGLYVSKNKGIFVINLFEAVMQNAIDVNTGHPKGSKVIRKIIMILESLKTSIVHSPRLELIKDSNKKNNTVQRLIQWNNLIPHEDLLPFPELIHKLIGIKCEEKDLNKACKIASTATEKIGFIVIYKVIKNPIEHKIMALIDKNYAAKEDLLQPGNVGINKKLYERTQTIKTLERSNSKSVKDSITVYDSEHVQTPGTSGIPETPETSETPETPENINYFYIVETLDGRTFRVLHPWNIYTKDFKIPATWVQYIPDIKKTPSRRLAGYSEIINDSILSYLQKPLLEIDFMSRKERIKADIKWKNIKENITRKLQEEYNPSKSGLASLISSDKFQNSVMEQIVVQLEKESGKEVRESEFDEGGITKIKDDIYYEEMSLSYIKDLDAIQNRLGRELISIYQKEYKGSTKSVNVVFFELMDRVLSKILSNKSNIFNTIQYKSELLRKTLLS